MTSVRFQGTSALKPDVLLSCGKYLCVMRDRGQYPNQILTIVVRIRSQELLKKSISKEPCK